MDRLHHVLVLAGAALRDEDHQVEVRGLVLTQRILDELRGADATASLGGPPERARYLILGLFRYRGALESAKPAEALAERAPTLVRRRVHEPLVDVHLARLVAAASEGIVVVAERIGKELRALEPLADGLFVVLEAREHGKYRQGWVEGLAHRVALFAHELVVLIDALLKLLRRLKGEPERAHSQSRGNHRSLTTRRCDPERRVRLLLWFGDDVPGRHAHEGALDAGVGSLRHHLHALAGGLFPHALLLFAAHAEAAHLHLGGGLTCAELDAAVGDEVERGDALGDAGGVVVARGHDDDAVAEANVLRPLTRRCKEDLRRGRMRVLLEEVVLDLEHVVEPELVRQLYLLESVLE